MYWKKPPHPHSWLRGNWETEKNATNILSRRTLDQPNLNTSPADCIRRRFRRSRSLGMITFTLNFFYSMAWAAGNWPTCKKSRKNIVTFLSFRFLHQTYQQTGPVWFPWCTSCLRTKSSADHLLSGVGPYSAEPTDGAFLTHINDLERNPAYDPIGSGT